MKNSNCCELGQNWDKELNLNDSDPNLKNSRVLGFINCEKELDLNFYYKNLESEHIKFNWDCKCENIHIISGGTHKSDKKVRYTKKQFIKKKNNEQVYDEYSNLPLNLNQAIIFQQNLTLKQIIILMNLHAIPQMLMNIIHENLQKCIKRKFAKITFNKRTFHVSKYYWEDLKEIERMILAMLDE